jgi:protein SCO1/2
VKKRSAAALLVACAAALYAAGLSGHEARPQNKLAPLTQTLLPVKGGAPLELPALVGTDGAPFGPERFRGRWSVLFFGYLSCPDVCPTTLQSLSVVARDVESGIAAGTTQIVFVSVDPRRDTPAAIKRHLAYFDKRFLGATGSREQVGRFAAAVGAASQPAGAGFDHSTSLFVVDPQGRLAGVLLRPENPARIVADLATLRSAAK